MVSPLAERGISPGQVATWIEGHKNKPEDAANIIFVATVLGALKDDSSQDLEVPLFFYPTADPRHEFDGFSDAGLLPGEVISASTITAGDQYLEKHPNDPEAEDLANKGAFIPLREAVIFTAKLLQE